MKHVPTQRLIEASARLDPASRALLNLWIHRGLPDSSLAEMAGIEPAVISERKLNIVEQLSESTGLPPYEVLAALRSIAPAIAIGTDGPMPGPTRRPETRAVPGVSEPEPPIEPEQNLEEEEEEWIDEEEWIEGEEGEWIEGEEGEWIEGDEEWIEEEPELEDERTEEEEPEPEPPPLDRRRSPRVPIPPLPPLPTLPWSRRGPYANCYPVGLDVRRQDARRRTALAGFLLLILGGLIATLIVAGERSGPADGVQQHAPSPDPALSAPARIRPAEALQQLPGVTGAARGEVAVVGRGTGAALRVTIWGLRPVRGAYYEVWLYNTIIDSESVGRFDRSRTMEFSVAPAAARFRWIDISVQRPGDRTDSGQSVVRAINPMAASS